VAPPDDHAVTYVIADEVLRRNGCNATGILYAVWVWDQWPFTNPLASPRGRSSPRAIARGALRHRFGFGLGRSLRHRLDITDVLAVKRSALGAHSTQMSRPQGADSWLTLSDVAGGDWLELLLRPHELYAVAGLGSAGRDERERQTGVTVE
jgi:LmbE family N-acetylglucosaminyl deacetylase